MGKGRARVEMDAVCGGEKEFGGKGKEIFGAPKKHIPSRAAPRRRVS
jgi:hypothetical protein